MTGEWDWDASWSDYFGSDQNITDTNSLTTSTAISNDLKLGTLLGVYCSYGGTVDIGLVTKILKDVDGTNFEDANSDPLAFFMPKAASSVRRQVYFIPGWIGDFKVLFENETGATITIRLYTKQATAAA